MQSNLAKLIETGLIFCVPILKWWYKEFNLKLHKPRVRSIFVSILKDFSGRFCDGTTNFLKGPNPFGQSSHSEGFM